MTRAWPNRILRAKLRLLDVTAIVLAIVTGSVVVVWVASYRAEWTWKSQDDVFLSGIASEAALRCGAQVAVKARLAKHEHDIGLISRANEKSPEMPRVVLEHRRRVGHVISHLGGTCSHLTHPGKRPSGIFLDLHGTDPPPHSPAQKNCQRPPPGR